MSETYQYRQVAEPGAILCVKVNVLEVLLESRIGMSWQAACINVQLICVNSCYFNKGVINVDDRLLMTPWRHLPIMNKCKAHIRCFNAFMLYVLGDKMIFHSGSNQSQPHRGVNDPNQDHCHSESIHWPYICTLWPNDVDLQTVFVGARNLRNRPFVGSIALNWQCVKFWCSLLYPLELCVWMLSILGFLSLLCLLQGSINQFVSTV